MKKLPKVDTEDLRSMTLPKLLQVRSVADEHFFAEMRRRRDEGEGGDDSPKLQAARSVQTLVQNEIARRAELEGH